MASFNATLDTSKKHTFIVEHMDPELEKWQHLEYRTIASECASASSQFILSGLPKPVSELAEVEQSPSSVDDLVSNAGIPKERVCLLDPRGESDLAPEDGDKFDVFVFGGILGDDPPRDRTAELRVKGFGGRRLGKEQLTTDTAARVTRIVVQDKSELSCFFPLFLGLEKDLLTSVKQKKSLSPKSPMSTVRRSKFLRLRAWRCPSSMSRAKTARLLCQRYVYSNFLSRETRMSGS
jgi:ribosome biogenesis SPOUT family RNA methylase Rps3